MWPYALWIPFLAQAALMGVDELHFHRRRGLPEWEIWGHPFDTLTTLAAILFLLAVPPGPAAAWTFATLAAASALIATKDELVHLERCSGGEQWVHSVLFLLHPTVFFCSGLLWWNHETPRLLGAQAALIALFFLFQFTYWGLPWKRARSTTPSTTPTATAGTRPGMTP